MNTYLYNITTHYENSEMTYSTNDVVDAVDKALSMLVADETTAVEMVDGYTGELLMYRTADGEHYITDDMLLMFMGYAVALMLGL